MHRGDWWATVHGVAELDTTEHAYTDSGKKSHFPLNCLKDADGGLYQAESSFQTGLFCLGQLRAWQEDLGLPSVSSSHLPVNCLPSSAAQAPSPSFLQDAASASTV